MPTWRTELPAEGKNRGYDLKRTPTAASLTAIVTSHDLLVCDTHYWHGRTTPCERITNSDGKTTDDSHCPACLDKAAWRPHLYLGAFDAKKREHFIFECTVHAGKVFQEYFAAAGTLRGCIFNATRPKCTPNAKVAIITHAADLSKTFLPEAPDVVAALSVIWRLPRAAVEEHPMKYSPTELRTNAKRLRSMRNQPDNAYDPPTIGHVLAGNGELQTRTLQRARVETVDCKPV